MTLLHNEYMHTTAAPTAAAGVSLVIGFDLHTVLGYAGQIVGLLSGVLSIAWIGVQIYIALRKRKSK